MWSQDSLRQLLVIAIMDEVLPQVTCWEDINRLQSSPDGIQVKMDPTKLDHPVFRNFGRDYILMYDPVNALNMASWLSRLGIRIGLEKKLISYCLRRGAAYLLALHCSAEEKCYRMGHRPGDRTYWKYYRCDTSTNDFQGVARGVQQEDVSRLSSISLNRREDAAKFISASGIAQVSGNPEIIALGDAEIQILDRLLVAHGTLKKAQ